MSIVRSAWRFLVGVKDALVLLLLLLFFGVLWAALKGGGAPLSVPADSALVLDLNGPIVDQANERSLVAALTNGNVGSEIELRDVLRAIDHARDDDHIKALVLDLDAFMGSGQANLQAIGRSLDGFAASKKPIYAYATAYSDDTWYLAAHAKQVWINPLGGVLLTGPGGTGLYFKKALDKLDVDVNVFRVGTYKSAVEPFTRSDASPEAKAAEQALVDTLWSSYRSDVAKLRPKVDINAMLANLPARVAASGGDFAKTALDAGLVDRIGSRADFGREVAKLVGEGKKKRPGSFNEIGLDRYLSATDSASDGSGPAVGIVYVAGNIVDGDAPRGTAGGETIAREIDKALANDDIKALVVRIDSPGGSVSASERIREALTEAKRRNVPVVASFGSVAASGGYWISTAAETIYAEPATITGSIGVFAVIPTFNRALAQLGIGADGVKSTPYSGSPDVLRGLTPETRTLLQASVENIYRRFTGLVAEARKLPVARVDEIGQGRVWAGSTAKDIGLVDQLGGLDAAVKEAARRAKLPDDVRTIDIERRAPLPLQLLATAFGHDGENDSQDSASRDAFARLARIDRARVLAAFGEAQAIATGPTIQASCLACAGLLPPRAMAQTQALGTLGLLTKLK